MRDGWSAGVPSGRDTSTRMKGVTVRTQQELTTALQEGADVHTEHRAQQEQDQDTPDATDRDTAAPWPLRPPVLDVAASPTAPPFHRASSINPL